MVSKGPKMKENKDIKVRIQKIAVLMASEAFYAKFRKF